MKVNSRKNVSRKLQVTKDRNMYIEQLMGVYEPLKNTMKESLIRQRQLRKHGEEECCLLADSMASCSEDFPCGILACPVCNRKLLMKQVAETFKLLGSDLTKFKFVTLIYYKDSMDSESFNDWDIVRFKKMVSRQIRRSGFSGIAVGSVEFDIHMESELWLPHLHLIMTNDESGLKALRKTMKSKKNMEFRSGVRNRPMVSKEIKKKVRKKDKNIRKEIKKLKNRHKIKNMKKLITKFKTASYCHKIKPKRIKAYLNKNGDRRTEKYRLRDKHAAEAYMKLSKIDIANLTFKFGVRSKRKA